MTPPTARLLAVDVGLAAGLAWYGADGRLLAYCSRHFANRGALRQAAFSLLAEGPALTHLALEGGGPLAEAWSRAAERRGLAVLPTVAETWRPLLFYPRERRTGDLAKRHADTLARQIIAWSEAPRPTSLRADAAEAICVGLWAVHQLGWLPALPPVLRQR
jgi:hypothetical protein